MPRDIKASWRIVVVWIDYGALLVAIERTGTRYKVRQEACQSPVSESGPVFRDSNMGVISSAPILLSRRPGLPARTGETMSGNHIPTVQPPCVFSEARRDQVPVRRLKVRSHKACLVSGNRPFRPNMGFQEQP